MNRQKNIFRSGSLHPQGRRFCQSDTRRNTKSRRDRRGYPADPWNTCAGDHKKSRHPIWRAVNIKSGTEFLEKEELFYDNITGIVVDGAQYGGGKTFDWSTNGALLSVREQFADKAFILAGGLNSENVKTGISIFAPDIVDVSSGVENDNGIGKNRDKIMEFVRKVKEHE